MTEEKQEVDMVLVDVNVHVSVSGSVGFVGDK